MELPPWNNSGLGRSGGVERFGLEGEIVNPVEVAAEIHVVLGPDLAENLQKFRAAPVALVMLEPRFTEMRELVFEPARDDVDGEAAVAEMIRGGAELGQHRRLPQPRMNCGDDLEPLRGQQQGEAEAGGFVLVLRAVAGLVANLRERVLEAVVLRRLRELLVVFVVPVGALLDIAGDQAAADIGHPVGELDVVGDAFSRHAGDPSKLPGPRRGYRSR